MSENQQYEQLETEIAEFRSHWTSLVEEEKLVAAVPTVVTTFPLIPQLEVKLPTAQYRQFIEELGSLLLRHQPTLQKDVDRLQTTLTEETLEAWFKAVVGVNTYYFEQFANKHELASWLPNFVAEHAARPFLKKLATLTEEMLTSSTMHGCPACGEPARLAVISKKGKKELTCPRCEYAWEEKKISCAHCGTDDHTQLEILKLEGQESAEIHVCHSCKGYTKIIDVRKMFKKESPQVLDTKSIHLDYIAQEKGFGIPVVEVVTH